MALTIDQIIDSASVNYVLRKDRRFSVILKNIADAIDSNYAVFAGWFADGNNYDSGIAVYEVARIQEYGTNTIPPRPFIRPAVDNEKKKWIGFIKKSIANELKKGGKGDFSIAFEKLGMMVQGDIQEYIHKVHSPPLENSTLAARARKRGITAKDIQQMSDAEYANFSKPLEDTGQMISTVSYKVYKGK